MTDSDCKLKSVEQVSRGVVATLAGEIKYAASPPLRKALLDLVPGRHELIVLDLSGVPYMDSSGVAVLVELLSKLRSTESKLVLCCMQDRVRSMFEIARLLKLFHVVDSRDAALAI